MSDRTEAQLDQLIAMVAGTRSELAVGFADMKTYVDTKISEVRAEVKGLERRLSALEDAVKGWARIQ